MTDSLWLSCVRRRWFADIWQEVMIKMRAAAGDGLRTHPRPEAPLIKRIGKEANGFEKIVNLRGKLKKRAKYE